MTLYLAIGPQEWGLIFLILLMLFGAKKLPELARGIGKSMGEFKKARDEFEHEITRGEDEGRDRGDGRERGAGSVHRSDRIMRAPSAPSPAGGRGPDGDGRRGAAGGVSDDVGSGVAGDAARGGPGNGSRG